MNSLLDIERYVRELKRRKENLLAQFDEVISELEDLEHQINMAEIVRENYSRHFHLEQREDSRLDKNLQEKFGKFRTIKEMLVHIASEAEHILDVGEARRILVRAGIFRDERNAATSIAPILSRNEEIFKRVGKGVYLLLLKEQQDIERIANRTTSAISNQSSRNAFSISPLSNELITVKAFGTFHTKQEDHEMQIKVFNDFGCGNKHSENQPIRR